MKEQDIRKFLEGILLPVFGFIPEIEIAFPSNLSIQIWFNGDNEQRRILMGKDGKNITAIHRMLTVFNHRQGFKDYIYTRVRSQENFI